MEKESSNFTDPRMVSSLDGIVEVFLRNIPYPAMLISGAGTIMGANPRLFDFFGLPFASATVWPPELFTYQQIARFFKNPAQFEQSIGGLCEQTEQLNSEEIETVDGRFIRKESSHFIVNGQNLGMLLVFRDEGNGPSHLHIAENKPMFYEDVLNKLPSDVAVLSPDLKYLFVNPKGIKDEAVRKWIIGKDDVDYCTARGIDISVAKARQQKLLAVLESKQELEWEEKIERNNQFSYHIRKISPVLDGQGLVKFLIGYGYDITQRKEYEKQIELRERKYKELFNFSQAIICTHNLAGVIIDVNPAFCEQTGYFEDEARGKPISIFLPDVDKPLFEINYLLPLQSNQKVKGLFRVVHKNGGFVYLLYQNYKVEEPGQDVYVVSFSQDVTDRVTMEKELREAKKLTEETAKIKQLFLANMSHEIRTPMSGIMGITALLQKTKLNDEQAKYLNIVQDSAQMLLSIINNILDLEKINTGNVALEQIPFGLLEKIQGAVTLLGTVAADKNLDLLLFANFAANLIVEGDPTRFSQILNNVIGNAIKFTHKGSITVTAELTEEAEETVVLHMAIADTGIGISEEAMEKIFTPFTQAYPETTRIYGGTGLGLAISKNLVDLQRGRLWVTSKLNIGSTFYVEIPFFKYKQQTAMSEITQPKQGRKINRKIKILLAEDNDINQLLANKIIQHFGFEAATADNGNDAIQLLMEDDFDVILMDIQMPEKNGIETAAEIRALVDAKKKSIPIIALTANALKGEERKYFAAGMNGYLTKPFKEKELYEAIVNVLPEEYLAPIEPAKEYQPDKAEEKNGDEDSEKLYNLDDLRMIQKDDESFVLSIIGLFIQNVPKNAEELLVATDAGDWEKVYFLAHKMKSSVELVNIISIKDDLRRVEFCAKTKTNLEEIPAKAVLVNTAVQKAAAQMKEEFGL
jgi:PAS domain S-box-containing protein